MYSTPLMQASLALVVAGPGTAKAAEATARGPRAIVARGRSAILAVSLVKRVSQVAC